MYKLRNTVNCKKFKENPRMNNTEESRLWIQYLSAYTAILLGVSTGLLFGWPSPAIPKLRRKDLGFEVSSEEISYIVMISPLGYVVGCPVIAILLDKIGRKPSILLLAVPQIIAWLLIANSNGVYMLYVARLTSGIAGGGALTAVPLYICEISDPRIRGALGTGYAAGITLGVFLIDCYGSYTPIRTSAYISLFMPLLFLATFMWVPESPYFFLIKGRTDDARGALKKLTMMNNVDDELIKLTADVQRQISEPKRLSDVFTIRSNLNAFFIVIGLRTLQQFTGGASISIYIQMIFEQAHGSIPFVESSIIFSGFSFFVCFFCSLVVDRFGRKPLIIFSTSSTGLCLFIEALYFCFQYQNYDISSFKWLPLTTMVLYVIARAAGLIPIPTLIAGELFSASIKAKAMGMVNVYVAFCFSISTKLFHGLTDSFGMHVPFFVFTFFSVLGVLFIWRCVPETKNQTLEEIQQKLKSNNSQ